MNADERHAAADAHESRMVWPNALLAAPLKRSDPWEDLMQLILIYQGSFQIENDVRERFIRLDLRLKFRGENLAVSHCLDPHEIHLAKFGLTERSVEMMIHKIRQFIDSFEVGEGLKLE